MYARARDFSGGVETGHRRPAPQVGLHAAHHVMRRRANGNAIGREVEARGGTDRR